MNSTKKKHTLRSVSRRYDRKDLTSRLARSSS
jgi:hypothetical protein